MKQPSCGSVFLSSHEIYDRIGPPGKEIDSLGLKGKRVGGHANFIVHEGRASSNDVVSLVHQIRNHVAEHTNIWLNCEVRFVAPEGRVLPLHEVVLEEESAHG